MAINSRNCNSLAFFFIVCAVTLPCLYANWVNPDEFIVQKTANAVAESLKAFNNDPEEVTRRFNKQVGEVLSEKHLLRRKMSEGECVASNPIDKCWRCDPKWATNRKRLADCARGFGRGVTGGKDGQYYIVTDSSDDDVIDPKSGTLRHAVTRDQPLWIVFKHSMVIRLQQELLINSNKTIDGRGVTIRIAYGAGLTMQSVQNVIIHNIRIHDIVSGQGGMIIDSQVHFGLRTVSDGDAISIFTGSKIWIDHVSFARCSDGLVDAIMGSTAITISNCKFNHHNDVMLLGADDDYSPDEIMQVTVAFNRFGKSLIQRMPRCRYGFVHVVNNDYNHWEKYAIGGSARPTIISQGNRFRASNDNFLKEVTHRDYAHKDEWKNWQWRSEGDLMLNGAFFTESGAPLKNSPLTSNTNIQYQPGSFVGVLTKNAGALKCRVNYPC
ncbi:lyase [Lithospermum erythrorhizon]|uniref:Pectate lyase n=1 Tax=Lithospermum erythrorhizon TaxID=34254 RepID=A0AAV3R0M4_LITER